MKKRISSKFSFSKEELCYNVSSLIVFKLHLLLRLLLNMSKVENEKYKEPLESIIDLLDNEE